MAQDFAAGCLGGLAGIIVGHPFDTVKIRGLYKGMLSPMAGVGLINAIIFGVHANVSRLLEPTLSSQCIAGGIAGAVQSIVCCPMELAKTRVQVQISGGRTKAQYHGSIDCIQKIFQRYGIAGCYRGMTLTLLREPPSFAIYFGTFEVFCDLLTPAEKSVDCIGPFSLLLAGGISGISSWVLTYPIDVIKSRFQADKDGKERNYQSIADCVRKTYRDGGLKSFTGGLTATILRAFPTNAATLATVTLFLRLVRNREQQLDFV